MAVPPDRLVAVAMVPCDLGPQAGLVHGGEVDLDERAGHPTGVVDGESQLDVGVGAGAPRAAVVRPVLPGVLVAAPRHELQPRVAPDLAQGDVEASDGRAVTQEQRIRRPLPRCGRGPLDEVGASTGEPPVERRRSRRRVRPSPLHERTVTQPGEAVVHGPLWTTHEGDQLWRSEHPMGVQQGEDVVVDARQTIGPRRHRRTTARGHRRPPPIRRRRIKTNLPQQSGSFHLAGSAP